ELLPRQRCAHRCSGPCPQAPCARDRAVAVVLVEVDEDAFAALLLPPRDRDAVVAALELATEADRRVAHVLEGVPRLDPHVDVDAAVAAGLGVAAHPELGEQLARDLRHPLAVA